MQLMVVLEEHDKITLKNHLVSMTVEGGRITSIFDVKEG
jgi:hypothetical protein